MWHYSSNNTTAQDIELVGTDKLTDVLAMYCYNADLNQIRIPPGLTNLKSLMVCNEIPNMTLKLLDDMISLESLVAVHCRLTTLYIPSGLINLKNINCRDNQLTELIMPNTLNGLDHVDCINNNMTTLYIPPLVEPNTVTVYASPTCVVFHNNSIKNLYYYN